MRESRALWEKKYTLFIHVHGSQLTAPANSGDRDLEILVHAGVEQGREENLQQEVVTKQ